MPIVAAALGAIGVVAVGFGIAAQQPAPPAPPAAPAAPPPPAASGPAGGPATGPADGEGSPDRSGAAAAPAVPHLDYSPPAHLRIPRLDVSSPLVGLGLDSKGRMETPVPVEHAGWFRPSPPPGVPGATVIAGHVTWDQEPTVFFRLGDLRPGDRVEVRREDGALTVFEVTRVGSFPKHSFPTKDVYDQPARSELRLITCGGEYDDVSNRYLDNVIVWARIVDVRT